MKNIQSPDIIKYVAVGSVGVVAVSLIVKMIRDRRKTESGKRAVSDENVTLATQLNSAIHPSRSWLSDLFSGADKDELFRLAGVITNFEDVAQEYKNLYSESLILDLQDALGTDYPDFMSKLQKVSSGTDLLSDTNANILADKLYNEIDGLNWIRRDSEPFRELLRLSDHNFKKVVTIYNTKHDEDFKTAMESEYGNSAFWVVDRTWDEIKENTLKRISLVFD